MSDSEKRYRGRIAPSPTGYLHLGHARTFWTAQERARTNGGTLVLRNDDLDTARCRPEFVRAMIEDLQWFGLDWQEGPDRGGQYGPYNQSERFSLYQTAIEKLHAGGFIYPCTCSRKDIQSAATAPHANDDELMYPGTCREANIDAPAVWKESPLDRHLSRPASWRFRVPEVEMIWFEDGGMGEQHYTTGVDFGDFLVWRHDNVPSYQLATVVDDSAMEITEVVRGADLLKSTARQLLLYSALRLAPPKFYHCPLMMDHEGVRLAKRHDATSLRSLRKQGKTPESLRATWDWQNPFSPFK